MRLVSWHPQLKAHKTLPISLLCQRRRTAVNSHVSLWNFDTGKEHFHTQLALRAVLSLKDPLVQRTSPKHKPLAQRTNSKQDPLSQCTQSEKYFDRIPQWPKMSDRVIENRRSTVRKVQAAIRKQFGGSFKVKPFGSTCYGADTPESDIDLVIMDPERPTGYVPHKKKALPLPKIYSVRVLGKALGKAGFKIDQLVPKAAVPIVKFRDRETMLACDVNVNELLGLRNTELIRRYCTALPLLPWVILSVKLWAAGFKWSTSVNSYTLALMTIGVFQTRGGLPNLQKGPFEAPPHDHASVFYARGKKGKGKGETQKCDTRFNHFEEGWAPHQDIATLDEGLYIWYRYWGYEHPYHKCMMDVKRGGAVPRQKQFLSIPPPTPAPRLTPEQEEEQVLSMLWQAEEEDANAAETEDDLYPEEFDEPLAVAETEEPTAWVRHSLVVRDPFLLTKNCGGQMTERLVMQFRGDCRKQADELEAKLKATASGSSILRQYPALSVVSPP